MIVRCCLRVLWLWTTATVCCGQTTADKRWTQRVYERLLQAMGKPVDAPRLLLLPDLPANTGRTLLYQPGAPGKIIVAQRVLSTCRTQGKLADDALACLLSHELAHFYYRHGSKQGFFAPIEMPTTYPLASENMEAVADRAGVFTAYLAGYNAFEAAPLIYNKLYAAYRLPDRIEGYPSRQQRLRIVTDTIARVRELAQLVEISELYYLLSDYEAASRSTALLLARYPTTITLVNAAAIKLNQALTRMRSARDESRLCYLFPVEYDPDNRLLANRRRDDLPYLPSLADALTLCQTAIANEPANQTAQINAAVALYLLGRPAEAEQRLAHLDVPNAVLMRAIIAAGTDPTKARRLFSEAVQRGAFRAVNNQQLFIAIQQSTVSKLWTRWLTYRQRSQVSSHLYPTPPTLTGPRSANAVRLPNGILYNHTESLTTYQLPVSQNGKSRLVSVWKSSQLGLPKLPLGSAKSRLSAYRPPAQTIAGARGTVFYGYTLSEGQLFLEYRQSRLVGWSWVSG